MKTFNVIYFNFNSKEFEPYDVIEPLVKWYKEKKKNNRPATKEEFKTFIINESRYFWWARCEYEVILQDWPSSGVEKKIDIYWQIMNNIDIIVDIVMEECLKLRRVGKSVQ